MFKHQECILLVCDVCGQTGEDIDFVPHWDTEEDALASIDSFDSGWTLFKGTHWCPFCNPPCSNCTEERHYFGDHNYGDGGCDDCTCSAYVLPELPFITPYNSRAEQILRSYSGGG